MFAYEHYGVKPDILTSAKALGCGVPVGAFGAREEVAQAMIPGDHGTTYGGNPLATAAVCKVFEIYEKEKIPEYVQETAPYLRDKLEELQKEFDVICDVRGIGFMQGMELTIPAGPVVSAALEKGLVLISAGINIIRFVPPLVAKKEHIDQMCDILRHVFQEI
jgi:acetylornithine/N-succinyldiaminopimelate aminotransferase